MTLSTSHPSRATPTQMALAADRRERLARMGKAPQPAPRMALRYVEHDLTAEPAEVEERRVAAAETVEERRDWRKKARAVVDAASGPYGFSYVDILTDKASHDVAEARRASIVALRHAFPLWSKTRIGQALDVTHGLVVKVLKGAGCA